MLPCYTTTKKTLLVVDDDDVIVVVVSLVVVLPLVVVVVAVSLLVVAPLLVLVAVIGGCMRVSFCVYVCAFALGSLWLPCCFHLPSSPSSSHFPTPFSLHPPPSLQKSLKKIEQVFLFI